MVTAAGAAIAPTGPYRSAHTVPAEKETGAASARSRKLVLASAAARKAIRGPIVIPLAAIDHAMYGATLCADAQLSPSNSEPIDDGDKLNTTAQASTEDAHTTDTAMGRRREAFRSVRVRRT